ncbi:hypothetical protein GLOIN_2v1617263, partial [Rhizophagus irregularis DAOM 181602=DAOM 197198]
SLFLNVFWLLLGKHPGFFKMMFHHQFPSDIIIILIYIKFVSERLRYFLVVNISRVD